MTAATTALVAAATLLPLQHLGELVNAAVLLMYGGICLAVLVLRRSATVARRTFRVPAYPVVPLAGMAACGTLLLVLPAATWWPLAIWIGAGSLLFAARRLRRRDAAAP